MKPLSILLFTVLFIFSCNAKKEAVSTPTEKNMEVAVVTEVPDVKKVEIDNEVEVEKAKSNLTEKTSKIAKTQTEIVKKDSTDINFYQEVKKRFYEDHELWDELLKQNVSVKGNIDYLSLKNRREDLMLYIKMLKMTYPNLNKFSKERKLAYWINTYNALTVDLILRNYPTKSIKDIKDPWDQRLWKLGDEWMNLNNIEHEILRKMDEPRIHFAIVCASVSCPKLQNEAFTAENLEAQLKNATKEFLADISKNEISKDEIKLSKIFKWFKKDFEQNGSLVDFLNEYSDITISQSAKIRYKDYDWDLND